MSLQHGILGFLNYGPCSGYELAKAFHSSVQFFWPAQTSQIYLTLGKLESVGLVTHETVIQTGSRTKTSIPFCPRAARSCCAGCRSRDDRPTAIRANF